MKEKNSKKTIEETTAHKDFTDLRDLIMPLDMKRDTDYIDSLRFAQEEPLIENSKKKNEIMRVWQNYN